MPPRKRSKDESAPETDDKKLPPSRRKGQTSVLEAVPDVEETEPINPPDSDTADEPPDLLDDEEPDNGYDEREQILDLLKKETGVLLDWDALETCLTVADWYRSARRALNFDPDSEEIDEDDLDSDTDEGEEDDTEELDTDEDLDLGDDLDDVDDSDDDALDEL